MHSSNYSSQETDLVSFRILLFAVIKLRAKCNPRKKKRIRNDNMLMKLASIVYYLFLVYLTELLITLIYSAEW
jgi:polyferredoxin